MEDERRERRTGIAIGFLAALALGLAVALVVVLTGDDDDGRPASGATATATPSAPAPAATTTAPVPTTTATVAPRPTISGTEAKKAAREGASREVDRFGISIPPGDWDARCTAVGGTERAATWRCQVSSSGGQCAGTVDAFALEPGVAAAREVRVGCGE